MPHPNILNIKMAALLVVAIATAMAPPPPCRARIRLQADTVPQAGSMLPYAGRPETPATPLPDEKIHRFHLSRYGCRLVKSYIHFISLSGARRFRKKSSLNIHFICMY